MYQDLYGKDVNINSGGNFYAIKLDDPHESRKLAGGYPDSESAYQAATSRFWVVIDLLFLNPLWKKLINL